MSYNQEATTPVCRFYLIFFLWSVPEASLLCPCIIDMTLVSGSGQRFTVYEPCPPHCLLIAILSHVLSIQTADLNQTSLIRSFYCTC